MTGILEWAGLAVVLGWMGFALTNLATGPEVALAVGLTFAGLILSFRHSLPVAGAMALLSPLGLMLPALALRDIAGSFGLLIRPFHSLELLAILLAYLVFLASAMGVLRTDLYRLGYAPLPVGAMVLALCAYGLISGGIFLPCVAVLAQAAWVLRWGSSNWFDHMLHATLVPVLVIALALRLI